MSVRSLITPAAGGLMFALVVVPASLLQAQANAKPAAQTNVKADSRLVHEVTADNLLEIRLGQLAEKKTSNAEVKQFGQRMVTDHTKLEDQWTSVASKNGLAFKPGLGRMHERKINRLEKVSGKDFDRSYMTTMIQQHQDEVDYLQNEGRSAQSAPVRDLVTSSLPTLQEHLTQAREIGIKVGADTSAVGRRHVTAQNKKAATNQSKQK
jgi:putative membrane protein